MIESIQIAMTTITVGRVVKNARDFCQNLLELPTGQTTGPRVVESKLKDSMRRRRRKKMKTIEKTRRRMNFRQCAVPLGGIS